MFAVLAAGAAYLSQRSQSPQRNINKIIDKTVFLCA